MQIKCAIKDDQFMALLLSRDKVFMNMGLFRSGPPKQSLRQGLEMREFIWKVIPGITYEQEKGKMSVA